MVNNNGNNTDMNVEQEQVVFERRLLVWCLKYVHDLCTDDNSTLDWITNELGVSELELFNGFENLSILLGFPLEPQDLE